MQLPALAASVVRYGGGAMLDRHAHDGASVSVVLGGAIEEEVGRHRQEGRLGSVVTKPPGIEHCNRVGKDGAILLAITGPDAAEAARQWRWTWSRAAAAIGIAAARTLRQGAAVEVDQLLDLLGLASVPVAEAGSAPAWLTNLRSQLDDEPDAPSVAMLARLSGVHPVYLARAFRAHFSCSIREYRRRRRVQRAASLLAADHLSVAEIAARLDFFDQSHLCRDFRAELAVSPSTYRAIVRS